MNKRRFRNYIVTVARELRSQWEYEGHMVATGNSIGLVFCGMTPRIHPGAAALFLKGSIWEHCRLARS